MNFSVCRLYLPVARQLAPRALRMSASPSAHLLELGLGNAKQGNHIIQRMRTLVGCNLCILRT